MRQTETTRRRYLTLAGAVAATALAGCAESVSDPAEAETETTTTTVESTTETTTTEATTEATTETGTETTTDSDAEHTPHDYKSVHFHGFLTFDVNGERTDYDETRYYEKETGNRYFHYHDTENENLWHVHAKGVTVRYALDSLPGITFGEEPRIELAGTTYDTADAGTSVAITVNNEPVEPSEYVLEEHDHLEVLIETDGGVENGTNGTDDGGATDETNGTSDTE